MENVKIKKIKQYGDISTWLVNGKKIRKDIDEEFTDFAQHYRFKFIPKHEIWIDKEVVPGEVLFYITRMLYERKLMSQGLSYSEAYNKAQRKELDERISSDQKLDHSGKSNQEDIKKIHKKLLREIGPIKVWLVNGETVRDSLRTDFTEGGHDLVYRFIPENEIWIDDDVVKSERKYVLLHELTERNFMRTGKKYDPSHDVASKKEHEGRMNEKKLEMLFKQESEKAESKTFKEFLTFLP